MHAGWTLISKFPSKCIGHSLNSNILSEVVYWIDLNKEWNLSYCYAWVRRITSWICSCHYQTIDGRRNREQICGSYFVIETIKLSYLGLLIVGLLQWGTMCNKILKSCCLGLVEFIHKDYNTLNYRRHKPYTGNIYCYDFLALFKMIFLLK